MVSWAPVSCFPTLSSCLQREMPHPSVFSPLALFYQWMVFELGTSGFTGSNGCQDLGPANRWSCGEAHAHRLPYGLRSLFSQHLESGHWVWLKASSDFF